MTSPPHQPPSQNPHPPVGQWPLPPQPVPGQRYPLARSPLPPGPHPRPPMGQYGRLSPASTGAVGPLRTPPRGYHPPPVRSPHWRGPTPPTIGGHFPQPNPHPTPPRRRRPWGLIILILTLCVAPMAYSIHMLTDQMRSPWPTDDTVATPPVRPSSTPKPTYHATHQPTRRPTPEDTDTDTGDIYKALDDLRIPLPQRCPAPPAAWSYQAAERYTRTVVSCIGKGYARALRARGYDAEPPQLRFFDGVVNTPCGASGWHAFYCSANTTVYWKRSYLRKHLDYPQGSKFLVYSTAAHEATHFAQQVVGILTLPSKESPMQRSRRLELQAICVESQHILYSPATTLLRDIASTVEYVSDRDHGLAASQRYWAQRARLSHRVAVCNTYQAPLRVVR